MLTLCMIHFLPYMQVYQLLTLILDMGETIHTIKDEKTDESMARSLIKMGQDNDNVLPPDAYANARIPDSSGADCTMDLSWMQSLTDDEEADTMPHQRSIRQHNNQGHALAGPELPSYPHKNLGLEDSSDEGEQDQLQPHLVHHTPPKAPSKRRLKNKALPLDDSEDDDNTTPDARPTKRAYPVNSSPPSLQPKRLKKRVIAIDDSEDDDHPAAHATASKKRGRPKKNHGNDSAQ